MRNQGFSLVELLIAMTVSLVVLGGVFATLHPAEGAFLAQPEAADLQQRLRAAGERVATELRAAGHGSGQGLSSGGLPLYFAPALPARRGRRAPDPAGTFRRDVVTVVRALPGAASTRLIGAAAATAGVVAVADDPGCPPGDSACGFAVDTDVALYDQTGAYDTFTVRSIAGNSLTLTHNMIDAPTIYAAGSRVAAISSRTYFVRTDASGVSQLMQYDGAGGSDVPIVDHVVDFRLEYFADPAPPALLRPLTESMGPWTTYGPAPPPRSTRPTAYPAGENCAFSREAGGDAVSRLPLLSASPALVPLTSAQLTDGPWCPDAASPNRYDADLLRVRQIAVTLRIEAAAAAVRGPAGLLFARGGRARDAARLVPDQELRLVVTPRAMGVAP